MIYKKNNDWLATKKGKKFGGIEKEGQFVIWPEEIKNEI
jgi:hypothetical protein